MLSRKLPHRSSIFSHSQQASSNSRSKSLSLTKQPSSGEVKHERKIIRGQGINPKNSTHGAASPSAGSSQLIHPAQNSTDVSTSKPISAASDDGIFLDLLQTDTHSRHSHKDTSLHTHDRQSSVSLKRSAQDRDAKIIETANRSLRSMMNTITESVFSMERTLYEVMNEYININRHIRNMISELDRIGADDQIRFVDGLINVIENTAPIPYQSWLEGSFHDHTELDRAYQFLNELRSRNFDMLREFCSKKKVQ